MVPAVRRAVGPWQCAATGPIRVLLHVIARLSDLRRVAQGRACGTRAVRSRAHSRAPRRRWSGESPSRRCSRAQPSTCSISRAPNPFRACRIDGDLFDVGHAVDDVDEYVGRRFVGLIGGDHARPDAVYASSSASLNGSSSAIASIPTVRNAWPARCSMSGSRDSPPVVRLESWDSKPTLQIARLRRRGGCDEQVRPRGGRGRDSGPRWLANGWPATTARTSRRRGRGGGRGPSDRPQFGCHPVGSTTNRDR